MVMTALQEGVCLALARRLVFRLISAPTQTLLPERAVEAFDEGLLIHIIEPGHAMAVTVLVDPLQEGPFQLTAAIRLNQASVISVRCDMSMSIRGLSDFYGNSSHGMVLVGPYLLRAARLRHRPAAVLGLHWNHRTLGHTGKGTMP